MTAHVLLNPASRGGRNRNRRDAVVRAFDAVGVDALVIETAAPGDAEWQARDLGRGGAWVVAAGGDGTVHEVANGLAGTDGVMSVLPMGTGNDFAAAVGMPSGLAASARALAESPTASIDLGRVRWSDGDSEGERWFANCLGIGFDAHAAAIASQTKWLGGRAAYLAAVARTLWAWRRPDRRVRIEADGLTFDDALFLCEVGNGHSVGGGFLLTPDAVMDDGLLDVCVVRHVTAGRAITMLPQSFSGGHVTAPEVTMTRTQSIRLAAATEGGATVGLNVQADGEELTAHAVHVEAHVEPGALAVRAPGRSRTVSGARHDRETAGS